MGLTYYSQTEGNGGYYPLSIFHVLPPQKIESLTIAELQKQVISKICYTPFRFVNTDTHRRTMKTHGFGVTSRN